MSKLSSRQREYGYCCGQTRLPWVSQWQLLFHIPVWRPFDVDQSPGPQAGAASLALFAYAGVAVLVWYVTYEIRKRGLLHRRERSPRETRMFATEAEAKMFARAKLDEGLIVFAGTINPHSPKQLVLSHDIVRWVAEQ